MNIGGNLLKVYITLVQGNSKQNNGRSKLGVHLLSFNIEWPLHLKKVTQKIANCTAFIFPPSCDNHAAISIHKEHLLTHIIKSFRNKSCQYQHFKSRIVQVKRFPREKSILRDILRGTKDKRKVQIAILYFIPYNVLEQHF